MELFLGIWGSPLCCNQHQHFSLAQETMRTSPLPKQSGLEESWGLHLAFPVQFVDFSCPTLSAVGQAAQNQSSAHSAAPRKGLQITGVRGSCTGNSTKVSREQHKGQQGASPSR